MFQSWCIDGEMERAKREREREKKGGEREDKSMQGRAEGKRETAAALPQADSNQ